MANLKRQGQTFRQKLLGAKETPMEALQRELAVAREALALIERNGHNRLYNRSYSPNLASDALDIIGRD